MSDNEAKRPYRKIYVRVTGPKCSGKTILCRRIMMALTRGCDTYPNGVAIATSRCSNEGLRELIAHHDVTIEDVDADEFLLDELDRGDGENLTYTVDGVRYARQPGTAGYEAMKDHIAQAKRRADRVAEEERRNARIREAFGVRVEIDIQPEKVLVANGPREPMDRIKNGLHIIGKCRAFFTHNSTPQVELDDAQMMLEYLADQYPAITEISDLIQSHQEAFAALPGDQKLKVAARALRHYLAECPGKFSNRPDLGGHYYNWEDGTTTDPAFDAGNLNNVPVRVTCNGVERERATQCRSGKQGFVEFHDTNDEGKSYCGANDKIVLLRCAGDVVVTKLDKWSDAGRETKSTQIASLMKQINTLRATTENQARSSPICERKSNGT